MCLLSRILFALAVLTPAVAVGAEDAYYNVLLVDLQLTEGQLPSGDNMNWRRWTVTPVMLPRVVLDGQGEAYVSLGSRVPTSWRVRQGELDVHAVGSGRLVVRAPKGQNITGRLYLPNNDWTAMVPLKFKLSAQAASNDAKRAFLETKRDYYDHLTQQQIPGGAWFRHERRLAARALGAEASDTPETGPVAIRRRDDLETFALFTGGRAVSENLQLDRLLESRKDDKGETVALDKLEGITVPQMDWKALLENEEPKLDPLASIIPADQHVVFLRSFQAAVILSEEAERFGTPILHMAEPRPEDARTVKRYERQLGLSLDAASRLLGPHLVQSVALTGSDPYFRTGTDVAVLLQTERPGTLAGMLLARLVAKNASNSQAKPIQGEIEGIRYQGLRSPDRRICGYIAPLDGAVVVTNSPHQLKRIGQVRQGAIASIASLDEFKFFRKRYPIGDKNETALLFLSDATIRRWCGPRWRIATSRRTREAAVLAELQASQMDALAAGKVTPGPLHTDLPLADGDSLTLGPDGVRSSVQGTLTFLTPIAEIPMDRVTKGEAEAYKNWRENYERNWRRYFDPIALQIRVRDERLSADLSVMPLILGTRYATELPISEKAGMSPDAADPHDTLLQVVMAVDKQSQQFQQLNGFASIASRGVALDWVGDTISVYLDSDPFWKELGKEPEKDREKFVENNFGHVPLALRIDVKDTMKLTLFLTGARTFLDQIVPEMLDWQALKYNGEAYVKISASAKAKQEHPNQPDWVVYYGVFGKSLVLTPCEALLHRAIDRQLAADKAAEEGAPPESPERPWLGKQLALRADRGILAVLDSLASRQNQLVMQRSAWGSLPILNEWRRRYPDQDPVELHEKVWGVRLVCPGGGKYVWNPKWQTMESTVYGHPGEPKNGPLASRMMSTLNHVDCGVTLENRGLRARMEFRREKPEP
ncbi:MAG: hypothetical protein JW818_23105 [Pirellulales bacterium]|nr:hypothetical protein [Pirellulales bacterium]